MLRTSFITAILLSASLLPANADIEINKQLVSDMVRNVFVARDVNAVDTYFTENYIQRNPMLPSGSATVKKFLSKPEESSAEDTLPNVTHRTIGEGDLVATHSTYYNFGETPLVAFDVFRIENGRIAEHWDNLEPLAAQPNPSGRSQVDGEIEITDLDKTEMNKALVLELLEKMFIGGEKLDITKYISPKTYIQHNKDSGDGLDGLQKLMTENAARGQKMQYQEIGIVVAEGNFVLTGSSGLLGTTATAFYDLWRIEKGLIVEHWDVIAPIQTENLPEGYPGKF